MGPGADAGPFAVLHPEAETDARSAVTIKELIFTFVRYSGFRPGAIFAPHGGSPTTSQ
jgi:hypothetical protein